MKSLREKFDSKWIPVTESGCWLWTDSAHRSGYGQVLKKREGKQTNIRAHRLSWLIHKGDIPDGLFVLHKCDVKACVNPNHLFLGTHADNMRDMKSKGRGRSGGNSKLTIEQVREVRSNRVVSGRRFAKMLGVTETTISFIRSGKTWHERA